jgi:hypothetical protein
MPTELLSLPPSYTIVGVYRLLTDPSVRDPVWAKVKHAVVRGALVGGAYAILGWGIMDWVVRRFIVRGRAGERVTIGSGPLALSIDFVLCKLIDPLLPTKYVEALADRRMQTRTSSSSSRSSGRSCTCL